MNVKTLIASMIFLAIAFTVDAQSSKKESYNFNVKPSSILHIDNSFGDIDVKEFDGNKIVVYIEIIVEAKNDKNSEAFLEKIYIDAKSSGNDVFLKTVNKLKGMRVNNFQVNYDVKIPKDTDVKINNSFGDVKVQSVSGSAHLTVQHGDCFLGNSEGNDNVLNVSFGDIRVIESGDIQIDAKHGDTNLGAVANLKLKSQFGDATVQNLKGDADVYIAHGDIDIELIGSEVQLIHIEAQFSDIDIEGLDGKDFKIELDGSFSDFDFDRDWYVSHSKKDYNTEGYILYSNGQNAVHAKNLSIKASHSDVDLD